MRQHEDDLGQIRFEIRSIYVAHRAFEVVHRFQGIGEFRRPSDPFLDLARPPIAVLFGDCHIESPAKKVLP